MSEVIDTQRDAVVFALAKAVAATMAILSNDDAKIASELFGEFFINTFNGLIGMFAPLKQEDETRTAVDKIIEDLKVFVAVKH